MKRINRKRGSALAIVVIFSTVIGIGAVSLLRYSNSESRLYIKHALRIDARNAAESLAEYAAAELIRRVETETLFNATKLTNDPVVASDALKAELFSSSNIDTATLEIKASFLDEDGEWIYISDDDPVYSGDSLAGKTAWVRTIRVSAKATATENGLESTAYVTNQLLVRDSPLLNYAIFYNMDAEFYPAQDMSITDDVHVNGDLYTGPAKDLDFLGHTTVSGNYYVQKHVKSTLTGKVTTFNGIPSMDDSDAANPILFDSNYADWDNFNPGYYGDNTLQTEVNPLTPVGMQEFSPDDPMVAGNSMDNSSYAIIEPILPKTVGGVANPDYKGDAVRDNKVAYEAGLILRVEYNNAYVSGDPANQQYVVKGYKYDRTDPSSPAEASDGSLELIPVGLPDGLIGDANATFDGIDNPTSTYPEGYALTSGRVTGGAYDARQETGMDMFTVDMAVLADVVNTNDSAAFVDYDISTDWNGVVYFEFPTSTNIEGSGEFTKGQSSDRSDQIVKAVSLTSSSTDGDPLDLGLQVINGTNLPRTSSGTDEGFTLGTNGPLYTIGSYNADGVVTSTSDTDADVSGGVVHDVPAALVSDTYTPLSANWVDGRAWSNQLARNTTDRIAVDTEISTAIITGSTPTRATSVDEFGVITYEGGTGSGGVQNFIRKHESWKYDGSTKSMAYRGSLVSLFHSEAHPNRLTSFYNSAPQRPWGYHEFFKAGIFPPGLPLARDYRRTQYRLVDSASYASYAPSE